MGIDDIRRLPRTKEWAELKIVLYVNSFLPTVGGKELVVHYLAENLRKLGHDTRVVGPAGFWKDRAFSPSYPIHRYPSIVPRQSKKSAWMVRLRELESLVKLLWDTRVFGCDIVHAHITYPNGYVAAAVRRWFGGSPVVLTPHGADIQKIPSLDFGLRSDSILGPKIEHAVGSADALTAISGTIRSALADAGADENNVADIPNGVDVARFQNKVALDTKEWLGLPADARMILTVGNYHKRKGQEVLIAALPKVLATDDRARVVIVGRGTEALEPEIKKAGLEDKVVLVGSVPFVLPGQNNEPDYLAALYQQCACYVSAGINRASEGLSLALLEAMASGAIVVATRISGNMDLISDQENGHLVGPGDPDELANRLITVLKGDLERPHIQDSARKTARAHSWESIARRYLSLYEQLVDGGHTPVQTAK